MRNFIALLIILTASPSLAADKVTLLLDWFVNPDHGPIIIAEENATDLMHPIPEMVVVRPEPNGTLLVIPGFAGDLGAHQHR